MKILVTGTAGFIGYHVAKALVDEGKDVIGLDIINDYYDTRLKNARLTQAGIDVDSLMINHAAKSTTHDNYTFYKTDLADKKAIDKIFKVEGITHVINLAAQAGVRYSLENPHTYINSNVQGFLNILEASRYNKIQHCVYASSSSVYGLNSATPFATQDSTDHPISLYAATKKSNELMAHTYSHLFGVPTTGLRFFTVYGPWGRPDMAYFLFANAIRKNEAIKVFNQGDMIRDFTYIDDIVKGILHVLHQPASADPTWDNKNPVIGKSSAPYRIYNIGNSTPIKLMDFIQAIEKSLGQDAQKIMMPIQPGDVHHTDADVTDLIQEFDYKPNTPLQDGINEFVKWHKAFYTDQGEIQNA